jgi:hypothetical protein
MLPTLFSKIGLPVLVNIIASALSTVDSPAAKAAAQSLSQVTNAIQSGGISAEQIAEANRHTEKLAEVELEQYKNILSETNKSLRAEISSKDSYVRRMRPTFGYIMAVTWGAQMLALAYIIVFQTDKAGFVLNAMGNLSAIWAMGLSVLGIYVYKRSEEKKTTPGEAIYWSGSKQK